MLGLMRFIWCAALAILAAAPLQAADTQARSLTQQAFQIFHGTAPQSKAAIQALAQSGRRDAVPVLVMALRYSIFRSHIVDALETLTGERPGKGWDDWMKWQEAHPETAVIPGFAGFQSRVFQLIDPNFKTFLSGSEAHKIRLEEIVWGGVIKDGIPALTNPKLIAAGDADYLNGDDLVFGVEINGDARAYPLRILDWHEMFNDVIGGVPVSLAYCTLCGSGILFETTVEGHAEPFVFGSSGFLYRSNKLMYDQQTHSLWNQFTGRPVVGELVGSGIELKTRPVVITTWQQWKADHAATKVLALETGHKRNYDAGAAYADYFASPDLMFPTNVAASDLKAKEYVFALRSSGTEKAWPLKLFEGGAVINDTAGIVKLVLIGDAATRTVRAYRSAGLKFEMSKQKNRIRRGDEMWTVTEDALIGPNGRSLSRLPGHIAYAFAWSGYFGGDGELATVN